MPARNLPIDDDGSVPVGELVAEYFAACESGTVELEPYLRRLGSDDERGRFRDLVAAARSAFAGHARFHPGKLLNGRYRLQNKLGAGGMGEVWSAHDEKFPREVAIKLLTAGGCDAAQSVAAIRHETSLMHEVRHPGIATVHDFETDGELAYFIMQKVDGIPLSALIANVRSLESRPDAAQLEQLIGQPRPDGEEPILRDDDYYTSVARIVGEILRILEAAHARGIVHRDIKPANIMLRGGGHPVLLDFGLGRTIDTLTAEVSKNLYGTAHYVAPERLSRSGGGDATHGDIYQVGAVFYELLTLQYAFTGESTAQILANVLAGELVLPQKLDAAIPERLQSICLKALARQTEQRYQTAQAFRAALQAVLDEVDSAPLADPEGGAGPPLGEPFIPARYRVQKELLRNAQLVRLSARDEVSSEEVILEYPGEQAREILKIMTSRDRNKILREARIRAKIKHPSVQRLQTVIDADVPILVLETRSGDTLTSVLGHRHKLEPEEVRQLGINMADALHAVHSCDVVHRAVSSDNILVETDISRATLSGFVFSKPIDLMRASSIMCADGDAPTALALPPHLAPEQLRGEAADARSDVFALGCVLYRCLTGEPAFDDRDSELIPPPDPAVPGAERLGRAICKCLCSSKTARYATMFDLRRALVATDKIPPTHQPKRLVLALIAAAVIAVSALAWWLT